ncbi:MAG: DDE-type integrase/transposase/recombinase, partial [Candidatus Subteraquimicrobiales bacterium]|nr:DDE-type integrase/transposase/recombinase [Candidatus Subteraquimicrobiales bacterium]
MKDMYAIADISKQALWQHNKRQEEASRITSGVVEMINKVRINHKRMGCRRIYYTSKESLPIGRDRFEQIGFANCFKLRFKRNVMKTTWSQRVEVYPNLIEGMVLNGINQVWQSDIFYLKVEGVDYYGVSIEDVYSRRLLALHLSKSLDAGQNVKALKKALKVRKKSNLISCIFHSDRGGQYISDSHKTLLKGAGMKISMCKMPQENAYVERVQGTLKHEYLFEHNLTEDNLHKMVN